MTLHLIKLNIVVIAVLLIGISSCVTKRAPETTNNDGIFAALQEEKVCTTHEDCVLFAADCCGCNQGGKQTAVNKNFLTELTMRRQKSCATIMCAQVISTDPSCKATSAVCTNGSCVLPN